MAAVSGFTVVSYLLSKTIKKIGQSPNSILFLITFVTIQIYLPLHTMPSKKY